MVEPGNVAPFIVYTVAIIVAACALVLGDRKAWSAPHLGPTGRA
jgi:hypothetical protein